MITRRADLFERLHRRVFGEISGAGPSQGLDRNLSVIDVYRTLLSTDTFPLAYQVNQPGEFPDLLLVSPALIDFNGTLENANVGIELWESNPPQFPDGTWQSSYVPVSRWKCLWRQIANQSIHVPWGRECVFVVRFVLLGGVAVPASGGNVGVSIAPWTP